MARLRPATLQQLARMICGDPPTFSDFPYRSGSNLTAFFTGLGFDHVFSGSRLPWTIDALTAINNESPSDAPFGVSENMRKIFAELMNPTAFIMIRDRYNNARDRVNELLLPYGLRVNRDDFDRVTVEPADETASEQTQQAMRDPLGNRPKTKPKRPKKPTDAAPVVLCQADGVRVFFTWTSTPWDLLGLVPPARSSPRVCHSWIHA